METTTTYYTCKSCGWVVMAFSSPKLGPCPNCSHFSYINSSETPAPKPARTQKGIGIEVLRTIYSSSTLKLLRIAQEEVDLAGITFPCFARPAPSSPKHGYIDSRVVGDLEQATKLLKEVLADDPQGELLLCGFLAANYNAIWTPGSLVIGRGHDGATAGKSTVTIPLAGHSTITPAALEKAQIGSAQWPFVEAVITAEGKGPSSGSWAYLTSSPGNHVILTQLRAGPMIDSVGDYIPALTEVGKIIKADPAKFKDRDWEILIDSVAGTPGVVVWHPGGAMTDHFSIHAFSHKIPILFGEEPKVGDILEPKDGQEGLKFDPKAMLKGVMAGEKFRLQIKRVNGTGVNTTTGAVYALLLALHNATACTGEASKWVGFASAIMLRLGVTALRGEARHLGLGKAPKLDRSSVYRMALPYSLSRHRAGVNRLVNIFRYGEWPSSGFGGTKWSLCGGATVGLFQAVRELAVNPSEENAAALVRALNTAVNQAHNGGWWLNKFCNQVAFDQIQKASIPWVVAAGPAIYGGGKIMDSLSTAAVDKWTTRAAKWPKITLRPPRVSSVQMSYQPGIPAVGLRIHSRILGKKGRLITAPVSQVIQNLDQVVINNTYLTETEDGYRVEIRPPGGEPVVLWEDESLALRARAVVLKG